jgi:WD40 repeat protein
LPGSVIHFTDPLTGKKLDGLTGPEIPVRWVTFAPDGKTLLLGARDGIRWWDPVAGKPIRFFEGCALEWYAPQRTPARFSPDGKMLVGHNGAVLLRWNADTGKPLFPEQDIGHAGPVTGLGVSPDGKWIATRARDSRVCVWDSATGKERSHAPVTWTTAPHIDFSPDGSSLYVGLPERSEVIKLDAATGKTVTTFATDPKGPKQVGVSSVRLSRDGKTVVALTRAAPGDDPGLLTTWNTATGARTESTEVPLRALANADLAPGAAHVACGGQRFGGVFAITEPRKNLLERARLPGRNIITGHFSDDGKWLTQININQTESGTSYSAVVISTLNWEAACTIPLAEYGHTALSPDGRTLALSEGETVKFYDTATAKSIGATRVPGDWPKAMFGHINVLRFTPDGTKLITGLSDTTALVWPVPAAPAK